MNTNNAAVTASKANGKVIYISERRKVTVAFYEGLKQQIEGAIEVLEPDVCYRAKDLCGKDYWKDLGNQGTQRTAGRCVAHMVTSNQLPLAFAGENSQQSKLYKSLKTAHNVPNAMHVAQQQHSVSE